MGRAKTFDLLSSFIIQYLMPIGLIPDFGWMMFYSHYSVLTPLAVVIMGVWVIGLIIGLQQVEALRRWQLVRRLLIAMLYMSHWIPVMVITTVRMCVQPKKLKWVKTEHQGQPLA
jgi:1,2-diacylglycerol 3-beta-glucosyltransferase